MSEWIILRKARIEVDEKYVGIAPNGATVKPVHIAGGSLRCIYGKYNRSMGIKRLALVSDSKGKIPKGNEGNVVYEKLREEGKLEDSIKEASLESMRNVFQRLLSADEGVFVVEGLRDKMLTYSAGSKFFLTGKSLHEDAGGFIGGLIREYCPALAEYIKGILDRAEDPISLLFTPVLEMAETLAAQVPHENLPAFSNPNASVEWFLRGLRAGGTTLLKNFEQHTNPLTQLRLFNLFCIFQLLRYMTLLSTFYCNEPIRPILLDFSGQGPSVSSVARASEMSYTQLYKAVNRFYAWGYASWLREKGYDKAALLASKTPLYEDTRSEGRASKSKVGKEELEALWSLAKARVAELSEEAALLAFGETMYDMLAIEASANPVVYMKALGTGCGILYPPDKQHPNKRFSVSQDVLEMLLRCCVEPEEILTGAEIRSKLWDRFGIIVGYGSLELEMLRAGGSILQVDEDALEDNFTAFAARLESMDFAEIMADGILQIRLGGSTR